MYGLTSSPSNWTSYRNDVLKGVQWVCNGRRLQLLATPEPNLSKVLSVDGADDEEALGFLALYVDDMAVVGEHDVVNSLLERIQQEWKCSSPEFVAEGSYVKFCGFELTKKGDQF